MHSLMPRHAQTRRRSPRVILIVFIAICEVKHRILGHNGHMIPTKDALPITDHRSPLARQGVLSVALFEDGNLLADLR
jgi:hypothetical protein